MSTELINQSAIDCSTVDLASLLNFAIAELDLNAECELNLMLVDEDEMTQLHVKWMQEPGPTDVLSFPMDEIKPGWKEAAVLGDIVVCPSIAARQAQSAGHSFEHEMAILSVHGLLHIVGYDHANQSDEHEMFSLQESLVARWSK
ncbi:MAG: rRNA maturation RNase YbeY [Actinobacteria bacterium]|nr:rRNA maturation RNase YbeY [Actinomycetota bacterium]